MFFIVYLTEVNVRNYLFCFIYVNIFRLFTNIVVFNMLNNTFDSFLVPVFLSSVSLIRTTQRQLCRK